MVDRAAGAVLAERASAEGIDRLPGREDADFRQFLAGASGALLEDAAGAPIPTAVIVSGMASSSIGWRELPYATLPYPLDGSRAATACLGPLSRDLPIEVFLVSGVRSADDILRGEETELMGLAAGQPWAGSTAETVVILPGTHSKHLRVARGALQDFRTYLTGELFDVLARHGILRHSVAPESLDLSDPVQEEAFRDGAAAGAGLPLSAALFRVRSRAVLDGSSPAPGAARLSGILVGAELRELAADPAPPATLLIAGAEQLARPYRLAADTLRLRPPPRWCSSEDAAAAVIRGHLALAAALNLA